jgi:2-polyprenyl-3-methyl-5-hydroxy-6-metoxy-1,4-benzoquinol methylase
MGSAPTYVPHFLKVVEDFLRLDMAGKTVIDCGCGYGRWGHLVRSSINMGGDKAYMIGCDVFEPYLKVLKKYNPYDDLVKCDIRMLPFRGRSVDVIIAIEVLEHMEKGEGYVFIAALEKLCREALIISSPVGEWKQEVLDENVFQMHRST